MKFAAVAVLAFASSAAALMPSAKLLKAARRLEQEEQEGEDEAEEEEYAFLANYKLKMVSCKSGEVYVNPENGENEYSSVVFRLCPSTGECSDDGNQGCSSGYGDYVIGLNSFVQEYLEQKKEEMNGDDDGFNVDEFGECREYEVDQDADEGEDEDAEQAAYFVGPACMEDGTGVRLAMFKDEDCMYASEDVTFEEISNGVALPYSSGGLVSNYCESCSVVNDNGEYELAEMCMNLYEDAGKCEVNMESFHYTGQQVGSCEFIESIIPRKSSAGAGKVIGWLFFVAFVVGGGYVAYTMFKKKDDKTASLMNA